MGIVVRENSGFNKSRFPAPLRSVNPTQAPPIRAAYTSPASTPRPAQKPKAAVKKPRKSPLLYLGMEDFKHALLCAPSDYIDCRTAYDTVHEDLIDRKGTLYRFTFTGAMRGFDELKKKVWEIPSEEYADLSQVPFPKQKRTRRTVIELADANGRVIEMPLFTGPWQWKDTVPGQEILVMGSIYYFQHKVSFNLECQPPPSVINKIWTRYKGVAGQFSGERIEVAVKTALLDDSSYRACAAIAMGETGLAESAMLQQAADKDGYVFESFSALLKAMHNPVDMEVGYRAIECAKRISAIAIQAAALRHHKRPPHPTAPIPMDIADLERIISTLPVSLTQSQRSVAIEICQRLSEPMPLTGLLSGDVGTGKTLAYLLPAVLAHRAGAKVSIIAPMQLLADQIFNQLNEKFGKEILTVERIEAGGKIINPYSILVGTSGLTSVAAKHKYVPNVLILDEQHKMSTKVKEAMVGPGTHVIEGSATPIPRSLAASLYEGMTIFNIRECPVKKKINSHVLDMQASATVIRAIRATLAKGERAAMVYPRVAASDEESNSVVAAYNSMLKAFPNDAVMLHGDMDVAELRSNIDKLRSGERRLVIASTVLEIGIDIPSVSLMVVRDAERFGTSQLHQLRGRLVRNGGEGDFMMVVQDLNSAPSDALDRLRNVESTNDGYELAEMDLIQRGFGKIDGSEQVGESSTLFRLIRLNAHDFVGKKLKRQQSQIAEEPVREVSRQERLI